MRTFMKGCLVVLQVLHRVTLQVPCACHVAHHGMVASHMVEWCKAACHMAARHMVESRTAASHK